MTKTEKIIRMTDVMRCDDKVQNKYNLNVYIYEDTCRISIQDLTSNISYEYPSNMKDKSPLTHFKYVVHALSLFISTYLSNYTNYKASFQIYNSYDDSTPDHKTQMVISMIGDTLYIGSYTMHKSRTLEHIFTVDLNKKPTNLSISKYLYTILDLYIRSFLHIQNFDKPMIVSSDDINDIIFNTFISKNTIFTKAFRGTKSKNEIGYTDKTINIRNIGYMKTYLEFFDYIYNTRIPLSNNTQKDSKSSRDKIDAIRYYLTNKNKAPIKLYTIMMTYFDVPEDFIEDFEIKQIKKCFKTPDEALSHLEKVLMDDVIELNTNTDINQIFYFIKDDCIYSNHKDLIRQAFIIEVEVNEDDIK